MGNGYDAMLRWEMVRRYAVYQPQQRRTRGASSIRQKINNLEKVMRAFVVVDGGINA